MFKLSTPPTAEVVTLDEVWRHLNVEADVLDDAEIALAERLVAAAVRYVEKRTSRQFAPATWELHLDRFPCEGFRSIGTYRATPIEIRKCPVTDVTEIAYTDANGDPQTLAGFQADTISEPARVFPPYGESWPSTRCIPNAVKVTFTAGYAEIPEEAKQAVLLLVGHWYANRETIGNVGNPLAFTVDALIDNLRWTL